ncbi:MAG: tetratricopeptide repeat protein [Bdellovibrionales bacterium]|nr:tetratricopeptide repeat protein [Bdellovibrionales bacterium]
MSVRRFSLFVFPLFLLACFFFFFLKRLEGMLDDMRVLQSEQTTQISAMEERFRQLAGRIEEIEYIQNRRVGGDLAELKKDIHKITSRVPPPPIVPANELESDEVLVTRWDQNFKPIGKKVLELVRLGRFREAQPYLNEALETAEGNPAYTPTLLFWQGVIGDGIGDNKLALKSYAELIAREPQHPRAPLAMLRQASVFIRLGDSEIAKVTLQKLMKDYPKSEYRARAQEKLKDL